MRLCRVFPIRAICGTRVSSGRQFVIMSCSFCWCQSCPSPASLRFWTAAHSSPIVPYRPQKIDRVCNFYFLLYYKESLELSRAWVYFFMSLNRHKICFVWILILNLFPSKQNLCVGRRLGSSQVSSGLRLVSKPKSVPLWQYIDDVSVYITTLLHVMKFIIVAQMGASFQCKNCSTLYPLQ